MGTAMCPNGHVVDVRHKFCEICGSPLAHEEQQLVARKTEIETKTENRDRSDGPSIRSGSYNTDDILRPIRQKEPTASSNRVPDISSTRVRAKATIIAGGLVLLIVVVLFFVRPNAQYNNVSNGFANPVVTSTGCISAWEVFSAQFPLSPTYLNNGDQIDYERASQACAIVIAGRDHVSVLLVIIGLIIVIAGVKWLKDADKGRPGISVRKTPLA